MAPDEQATTLSDAELAEMLVRAERNAPAIWVQAVRELQAARARIAALEADNQRLRAAAEATLEAWNMVYLMTDGLGRPDGVAVSINSVAKREDKNLRAALAGGGADGG